LEDHFVQKLVQPHLIAVVNFVLLELGLGQQNFLLGICFFLLDVPSLDLALNEVNLLLCGSLLVLANITFGFWLSRWNLGLVAHFGI
jgi:hypothetical protein